MKEPKTLQQAIQYFADYDNCRQFMISVRWADGKVRCPYCGAEKLTYLENARLYRCYGKHPRQKFSLKVGTIFEDSPIPLEKWLPAVWLIVNCKNGISSYEIHRALGVTQKTGWFMLHRIRLAMQHSSLVKIGGDGTEVEVDETFVGGKVRTAKIDARSRENLHGEIRKHVSAGSALYSDEWHAYRGLESEYVHKVIDHAEKYVDGRVHTNGLENFWSLLKRGLNGTYVAVEPFHLFRYLDEQAFRYNNR